MLRIPLASLPLHAVDLDGRITLRRGSDDEPEARVVVLGCDADAVRAAAPHLGAVLWLSLCDGPPAPAPSPSRDELAARLAECEREVAAVTRERDDLADLRRAAVAHDRWVRAALASLADGRTVDATALHALGTYDTTTAELIHRLNVDLAARVDREPPQRAPGVVAGVAADVVDVAASHLGRALRGAAAAGRRAAGGAR